MKQSKKQFKYAVRRLKRCSDKIQADRFVSELLNGGGNIFKEIRKFRGSNSTFSSRVDEEVGSHNIANHFASIYERLYNNVSPQLETQVLIDKIQNGVDDHSEVALNRITEEVIKEALK